MKKMMTLVLALVFVLGFASAAFAMGPDGDTTNVGFVLTNFVMADQMLSPLAMPNWTGALNANKAIAEGQPVWFVAHYVQNKWVDGDSRNFTTGQTRTTVFTSKDNTVNWAFSDSYMNFVWISKLEVLGGSISATGRGKVTAEENKLEVKMTGGASNTDARPADNNAVMDLTVAIGTDSSANYYLQIMGFTKACTEAQGTVYAKTPIDVAEFATPADAGSLTAAKLQDASYTSARLSIYDENNNVKYTVVRFQIPVGGSYANLNNLGATGGDYIYYVYNADNDPVVGFLSSNSTYRGLVVASGTTPGDAWPVQWSSDDGGKWGYTSGAQGVKAISDADLKAVMAFFDFSFGTTYPVLARHFEARAGYWMVKEAKYNVAAAVIVDPDGSTDPVPKTGDVASSMGLIMIAIALSGLAAVGFVVSKRVHN